MNNDYEEPKQFKKVFQSLNKQWNHIIIGMKTQDPKVIFEEF